MRVACAGWRDPFVLEKPSAASPWWYVMIGAGVRNKCGTALVYRSKDLTEGGHQKGLWQPAVRHTSTASGARLTCVMVKLRGRTVCILRKSFEPGSWSVNSADMLACMQRAHTTQHLPTRVATPLGRGHHWL